MAPGSVLVSLAAALVSLVVIDLATFTATSDAADAANTNASELMARARAMVEADETASEPLDLAIRAVGLNPADGHLQVGLGEIYHARGDLVKAEELFTLGVAMVPDSWDAQYDLGMTRGLRGNFEGAIEPLRRAIELKPGDADTVLAMGSSFGNLDQFKDAEQALLQALAMGSTSDVLDHADDQLQKLWRRQGWAVAGGSKWESARKHEMESIGAVDWAAALATVRAKEADAQWQKERTIDCAKQTSDINASCGPSTVFFEAWEAAWKLVEKLARRPHGQHVVLGDGLGALCTFALHIGGAAGCTALDRSCLVVNKARELAKDAVPSVATSFQCGKVSSEDGTQALNGVDVVWVVDGQASREAQAGVESHIADAVPEGVAVVLFRAPHAGSHRLHQLGSSSVELFCIASVNEKCFNHRPAVGWQTDQKLDVFVLESRASAPQEEKPQTREDL